MTNYNRIKRPVEKPHEKMTIKLKLSLAQIVDVVSATVIQKQTLNGDSDSIVVSA